MTDAMMNLRHVLEKSADADLLREMIGFAAERLHVSHESGSTSYDGSMTAGAGGDLRRANDNGDGLPPLNP